MHEVTSQSNKNDSFLNRWIFRPFSQKKRKIKKTLFCFFLAPLKYYFFKKEMALIEKERNAYKKQIAFSKNIIPFSLENNLEQLLKIISLEIAFQKKERCLSKKEDLLKKNCRWFDIILNTFMQISIYFLIIYYYPVIIVTLKPIAIATLKILSGILLAYCALYARSTVNKLASPKALIKSLFLGGAISKLKKGFAKNQDETQSFLNYDDVLERLKALNDSFESEAEAIIKINKIPLDSEFKIPTDLNTLPEYALFKKIDENKNIYTTRFEIKIFKKLLNELFPTLLKYIYLNNDDFQKYYIRICELRYSLNLSNDDPSINKFEILEEVELIFNLMKESKKPPSNNDLKKISKKFFEHFNPIKEIAQKTQTLADQIMLIDLETKDEFEKKYMHTVYRSFIEKIQTFSSTLQSTRHQSLTEKKAALFSKIKNLSPFNIHQNCYHYLNKMEQRAPKILSTATFETFFQFVSVEIKAILKNLSLFSKDTQYYKPLKIDIDRLLKYFETIRDYKITSLKNNQGDIINIELFKIQRGLEMFEAFNSAYVEKGNMLYCENFKKCLNQIIKLMCTHDNDEQKNIPCLNATNDPKKLFSNEPDLVTDWLFSSKEKQTAYLNYYKKKTTETISMLESYFKLNTVECAKPNQVINILQEVDKAVCYLVNLEKHLAQQENIFKNNSAIQQAILTIKTLLATLSGLPETEKNLKMIICQQVYKKINHPAKLNIKQLKNYFDHLFSNYNDKRINRTNSGLLEKIFSTLVSMDGIKLDENLNNINHLRSQLSQYHDFYDSGPNTTVELSFERLVKCYSISILRNKITNPFFIIEQYSKNYEEKIKALDQFFEKRQTLTLSDEAIKNTLDKLEKAFNHLENLIVIATTIENPNKAKKSPSHNIHSIFSKKSGDNPAEGSQTLSKKATSNSTINVPLR